MPTFNSCTYNAWAARPLDTTASPIATVSWDLTTERSFDSQAPWVFGVLDLFLDILFLGLCTTRLWQTSGRLVQELNVCTVRSPEGLYKSVSGQVHIQVSLWHYSRRTGHPLHLYAVARWWIGSMEVCEPLIECDRRCQWCTVYTMIIVHNPDPSLFDLTIHSYLTHV